MKKIAPALLLAFIFLVSCTSYGTAVRAQGVPAPEDGTVKAEKKEKCDKKKKKDREECEKKKRDKRKGADGADGRTILDLPAKMKVKQKAMMRMHLDTVADITLALAENDLVVAGGIATERLGRSPDEEAKCKKVAKITGEPDFVTLGLAVHDKADELASYARAGDRDKALRALSELISRCNACHERFRL